MSEINIKIDEPGKEGGTAKLLKRTESTRLLLNLHHCDFSPLLDSRFLPANNKGKQPLQRDWTLLGAEQGFFISQVIHDAQQPGS